METLAIVGTGIAGLGCAHFLQHRYQLTVYEKNDYVGGHTNTVSVDDALGRAPVDTGFMTYNEITYPNLTRLFRELAVETRPSSMSFSVQHLPSGLEFSGSSLNHLFGQRRNLLRPGFWRMLLQIDRFNREALEALKGPQHASQSIGEYVRQPRLRRVVPQLLPAADELRVWSTPPTRMLDFPAITLLRFYHNHGFLGLHTQHPWRTVQGGARQYVEKLIAPLRERIFLQRPVIEVRRVEDGIAVTDASGERCRYDHVILAGHADQSLRMLVDADDHERGALAAFKYHANSAFVHTDERVMPHTGRCWSSWNYPRWAKRRCVSNTLDRVLGQPAAGIQTRDNYFVSIDGEDTIAPERILQRIEYEHPTLDHTAVAAQKVLPSLNERRNGLYFCGSYFRYGFHEDAFSSALAVSRVLEPTTWH